MGLGAFFGAQPRVQLLSRVRGKLPGHRDCVLAQLWHTGVGSRVPLAFPVRFHVDSDAVSPVLDTTRSRVSQVCIY